MATSYGPKLTTSNIVLALDTAEADSYFSGSSTWKDVSGNNNTGTIFNSPRFDSTNGGNILFTSGSFVEISSSATITDLSVGNSVTLLAWVKRTPGSSSWLPILTKVSSSGADNVNYELTYAGTGSYSASQNSYTFAYRDSTNTSWHAFSTSTAFSNGGGYEAGLWHHVAFTYTMATGSTARFYVDGEFESGSWRSGNGNSASLSTNNGPLYIGKTNQSEEFFTGSIGAIQIYNRILSVAEIQQNYRVSKERFGHPISIPTFFTCSIFPNVAFSYSVNIPRRLSNAGLVVFGKGTPSGVNAWTASLASSSFTTRVLTTSLSNGTMGGRLHYMVGGVIGDIPAGIYSGSVSGVSVFGNTGMHLNLTFIENVKQDGFHPGAVVGGFTNYLTMSQPCSVNDFLVIVGSQQGGAPASRLYQPPVPITTLLDTEGEDWFAQTLISRNTVAGSSAVQVDLYNPLMGGNSILLSTAAKRLK
jgi:hypothetical protein